MLALFTLVACSEGEVFEVTPEEARDEFLVLIEATQDSLGVDFEVRDNPTSQEWCDTPGGQRGRNFLVDRFGPAPEDRDAALATVRELWEGWGYAVREVEIGPVKILEARPEHDAYMEFGATAHSLDLSGHSGCIPPEDDE
jgi:hypothetical protein